LPFFSVSPTPLPSATRSRPATVSETMAASIENASGVSNESSQPTLPILHYSKCRHSQSTQSPPPPPPQQQQRILFASLDSIPQQRHIRQTRSASPTHDEYLMSLIDDETQPPFNSRPFTTSEKNRSKSAERNTMTGWEWSEIMQAYLGTTKPVHKAPSRSISIIPNGLLFIVSFFTKICFSRQTAAGGEEKRG